MLDLLVQIAIVAAVLAMLVLFVSALDRRPYLRERASRSETYRHWWNRVRGGHYHAGR